MKSWQHRAEEAQQSCLQAIPAEFRVSSAQIQAAGHHVHRLLEQNVGPDRILSDAEYAVLKLDATVLVEQMSKRVVTVTFVVTAFLKAAAIAHQATNCLTHYFYQEALAIAKEKDAEGPQGRLFGLPISIKDCYNLKGTSSSAGYVSWLDHRADSDALLVDILKESGAIVIAKTTTPQSMYSIECFSNAYGRTLNPFNTRLSSGGSTGGEAALIAFRGSTLGIGGDSGGSIRVPAASCGIFGFKPTSDRLPTNGTRGPMEGCMTTTVSSGPLAPSLEALKLFMQVVLSTEPWTREPQLVAMPWRRTQEMRKIRVGIMYDDGLVMPMPPVQRALRHVTTLIQQNAEFEVVEFKAFRQSDAERIVVCVRGLDATWLTGQRKLFIPDGGKDIVDTTIASGEPLCPLIQWAISEADILTNSGIWALTRERTEYQKEFQDRWISQGIDVLLCPCAPFPASLHDTSKVG